MFNKKYANDYDLDFIWTLKMIQVIQNIETINIIWFISAWIFSFTLSVSSNDIVIQIQLIGGSWQSIISIVNDCCKTKIEIHYFLHLDFVFYLKRKTLDSIL